MWSLNSEEQEVTQDSRMGQGHVILKVDTNRKRDSSILLSAKISEIWRHEDGNVWQLLASTKNSISE